MVFYFTPMCYSSLTAIGRQADDKDKNAADSGGLKSGDRERERVSGEEGG